MSPARRILVINPNSNTQVTEGFSEALESLRSEIIDMRPQNVSPIVNIQ